MVVSESKFGAYICLITGRPAKLHRNECCCCPGAPWAEGLLRRKIKVPSPDRHNKSVHAVFLWGLVLEQPPGEHSIIESWPTSCLQITAFLAYVVDKVPITFSHRSPTMFRFFHFRNYFFYDFFFNFTMVIKRFRKLGGECAFNFGDQRASRLYKFSVGINSDLGNGSFVSKSVMLSM